SGLTYSITGGADSALFSIDSDTGVVTFNAAPDFEAPSDANADNDYNLQVTVTDSGGLTDVQNIVVSVTDEVEVAPPDAVNDAFDVTGNIGIDVGITGSILNNDTNTGALTGVFFGATAGTAGDNAANGSNMITTSNGGVVLLNADGTFTYDPAAGFDGTDSFFYTLSNAGGSDVAEVEFTVDDVIWFIDNSAAGSTNEGTLDNPFTSLAAFDTANDGVGNNPEAGDNIFLYSGSGNYTGGVTLLDNQTLIGQGATGTSLEALLGITLAPFSSSSLPSIGGTDPVITNASGDGITLASGNTIRGLNIDNTSGDGISGTNVSDIAISEVDISNTGVHGIDLNTVTNFTYEDSEIIEAGNGNAENSIHIRNLFGTNLIEDVRLDEINENGIDILNNTTDDGTTDSLTIRRLDVEEHSGNFGEDGIFAQANGTSNFTLLIDDSNFDINEDGSVGVSVNSNNTATLDLTIQDSTFNAGDAFGAGSIVVNNANNSNATVVIYGNDINNSNGNSINVLNNDNATSVTTISNNDIDGDSTDNGGIGIRVLQDVNGSQTVLIDNNTIDNHFFTAIQLIARDGNGVLNATVTNNTNLTEPLFGFEAGLGVLAEDNNTLNANISGNNFTGVFFDDINLTANNSSTLNITQTSAANLSALNNGDSVATSGSVNFNQPAPPTP
ncbi:MAG: hypothetical protein F6K14_23480, partial [Symploca sp. SIO2C1]|nr:hypothetical protein [Symploca sp. SIO2C1]